MVALPEDKATMARHYAACRASDAVAPNRQDLDGSRDSFPSRRGRLEVVRVSRVASGHKKATHPAGPLRDLRGGIDEMKSEGRVQLELDSPAARQGAADRPARRRRASARADQRRSWFIGIVSSRAMVDDGQ